MQLSVVTTLYNSQGFIEEFHRRASAAAVGISPFYEIIFVNDGSPDDSLRRAVELSDTDDHVKVVEFSRNFGHHAAAYAAIEAASGERIFLIDSDLEESPEWVADFARIMDEEQADLVYGVQRKRAGGIGQKASGLFYRLFNTLSETKIPRNVCTVRMMNKRYKSALLEMREKNLFLAGMFAWTGFKQVATPVDKKIKESRQSNYTPVRMFRLLVDAITSFSAFPLYLAFFLGLALSSVAGLFGVYMVIRKLLVPDTVLVGYASLITSIFLVGGLIILFLGVFGIYLSKIFNEVKDRPRYMIRQRHGFERDSDNSL
jgi:putative glycosyltransferase